MNETFQPAPRRVRSHRDLLVWQRAIQLIQVTYRLTARLPRAELFGLISQMRRSAVSVAANIAEGRARYTSREFLRFLAMANGSLRELETYWELTVVLKLCSSEEANEPQSILEEIGRMLTKLRATLLRKSNP